MTYLLGDIFIGSFPITQPFGADPTRYAALYGLKGHNGIDFGCPEMTLILSAADGFVSEVGFDSGGYGNYLKVVHNGYLTLYGHLHDIVVKKGDRVVAGQLIAHSNNTGFSTGPHLHFGVAPADANGVKTEPNNGYSGYIDPDDTTRCSWQVKNLTSPVVQEAIDTKPPVSVPFDEYPIIVAQGSNYKQIVSFALSHGLNDYLSQNGQGTIDLTNNPGDPEGGNKTVSFLANILLNLQQLEQTATIPVQTPTTPAEVPVVASDLSTPPLTQTQKQNVAISLLQVIKDFIFAKP